VTSRPPVVPAILAIVIGLFGGIALVDKLGSYRWFFPYDPEVYSAALIAIVFEMIFVIPRLMPWLEAQKAQRDREDDEIQ
jgi:hypothetical protein